MATAVPPADAAIVVVDIGGTYLRTGVAKGSGEVAIWATSSADRLRVGDPVGALADLIASEGGANGVEPLAAVLGIPGFMDRDRRIVVDTPNIPSLRGVRLADELAERCGFPVQLEHDAALLLQGEHAEGSARGFDLALGVFFGTGIGAAFLQHGRPFEAGPYAMQLGHITVRGEGRPCACGGIDCVEGYASGRTLQELASRFAVSIDRVFVDRHTAGELDRALAQFVDDQALAVATAITLTDPDITVIGGGIPAMPQYPSPELFAAVVGHLSPVRHASPPRLTLARLGWPAVLHGAWAVAGRHRHCGPVG